MTAKKLISLLTALFMVCAVAMIPMETAYADEIIEEIPEEEQIMMTEAPQNVSVCLYGHDDIKVSWSEVEGASGYYVYYKRATAEEYTFLGKTDNTFYRKGNLTDGAKYVFKVASGYSLNGEVFPGNYSESSSITTLKKLGFTIKRISFSRMQLSWDNIAGETGYQISRSIKNNKTNIIYTYKSSTASKKVFRPDLSKKYYYKIRAYKVENGDKVFGPWSSVKGYTLSKNYYPKLTLIKKDGKFFDLRKESGQKLYGYDIFQGSCTDGTYGYYVLYNKSIEKCRISKIRLSDNKVVKVSGVLNIHHGNDLTYNSKTNRIVAVHTTVVSNKVAFINPKTLKVVSNKTIKLPSSLPGVSKSKLRTAKGFNAIAYDKSKNRYVLRVRNKGDFIITDGNLKPVKYITPSVRKSSSRIYQGMDIIDGYIACQQAANYAGPKSQYSVVKLYTWSGKYKGCIYVNKKYELECVFNYNGTGYVSYYHEYHEDGKLKRNNYIYKCKL